MKISLKFNLRKAYTCNGITYKSLDEMPPDVRKLFERAVDAGALSAGAPAGAGDTDPDPEEQEIAELENLLDQPGGPHPGEAAQGLITTENTSDGYWYAGVVGSAAFLLVMAYVFGHRALRAGNTFSLLSAISLACGIAGFGLIARQRWARVAALVCGTFIGLSLLAGMPQAARSAQTVKIFGVLAGLAAVSTVYLLLPPVRRLFAVTARENHLRQELRLLYLAPPPRQVPFSLQLSLLFGRRIILFCGWPLLAMATVMPLVKLKQALGGFAYNPSAPLLVQAVTYGVPAVFLLIIAGITAFLLLHGEQTLALLRNGVQGYAVLVKKARIHSGEHALYRLLFAYEAQGKKYKTWVDTPVTSRMEDEAKEPLLYDPQKPGDAVLLDALPAHITVTREGGLHHRFFWMGYVYACIPLVLAGAVIYIVVS